ncbi:MAG: hypothetical protein KA297_06915 [Kofleriaceae bacterium]|nr:hypothetical protein [Kofleriaceae bacterium]
MANRTTLNPSESALARAVILDILDRRQAVAASVLAPALELLERVVAMLARLAGA